MTEKIRYNLKEALLRDSFYDSDELMILRNNPTRLIDRGYEYFDDKLTALGASFERG